MWPSLVGVVVGGLGVFSPTFGVWIAVLFVWFVASLPGVVFVVRGLYRSFSPASPSTPFGILAAVCGIPLACLCLYLGLQVFGFISSPTRFA